MWNNEKNGPILLGPRNVRENTENIIIVFSQRVVFQSLRSTFLSMQFMNNPQYCNCLHVLDRKYKMLHAVIGLFLLVRVYLGGIHNRRRLNKGGRGVNQKSIIVVSY